MLKDNRTYLEKALGERVNEEAVYAAWLDAKKYDRVNRLVTALVPAVVDVAFKSCSPYQSPQDWASTMLVKLLEKDARQYLFAHDFGSGGEVVRYTCAMVRNTIIRAAQREREEYGPHEHVYIQEPFGEDPEQRLRQRERAQFLRTFTRTNLRFDGDLEVCARLVLQEGEDAAEPLLGRDLGEFMVDYLSVVSRIGQRVFDEL